MERDVDAVVGVNVRSRRAGLGMNQEALASLMTSLGHEGWGPPTVSRVESGKRSLTVPELVGLCVLLRACPEDLLDPMTFDDESDVMAGIAIPARQFRAVIRGTHRPRYLPAFEFELVPTDRGTP